MGIITFNQGELIATGGQTLEHLYIITKGNVNATYHTDAQLLTKGDVVGLIDLNQGYYTYEYTADSEVSLISYPCRCDRDLMKIIDSNADFGALLAVSITKSICHVMDNYIMTRYNTDNLYHYLIDSYSEYKTLCLKYAVSAKELPLENIFPLDTQDDLETWMVNYYESLKDFDSDLSRKLFIEHKDFLFGYIKKACFDAHDVISKCDALDDYQSDISTVMLNSNHLDLFDLYSNLICKLIRSKVDTISLGATISKLMIQMEGRSSIEGSLYQSRIQEYRLQLSAAEVDQIPSNSSSFDAEVNSAISHSLDTILSYSACSKETTDAFRQLIYEYKDIVDKTATTDFLTAMRKKITSLFYEIYTSAFQVSLSDIHVPVVLKMFFLFGYVDEDLAGKEASAFLYQKADSILSDYDRHIYTLYDWLKLIYDGKKEPSRNEFDNDYTQYVHELKVSGEITDEISKKMMVDNAEKVMYEIHNMFPLVNKITYGRISTYCPVFSEHNLFKEAETQFITADRITDALTEINEIDYSAFYRETIYSDPSIGINKEPINVDIRPDIILMPNIGLRGVMWQEIEGKRRTTPARMMIPIMYPEDLKLLMCRLIGEYRWEMCKRIQGARWNDISDLSLTSEYFDYIQFYRKNSELSPDVREKIKILLQKSKGSYRETFVRDYVSWIVLEGKGSPVLNKVTRKILFTYCPFSASIRTRLKTNPMYKEYMNRYDIKKAQYLHHLDNVYTKILNSGKQIPDELEQQKKMVEH